MALLREYLRKELRTLQQNKHRLQRHRAGRGAAHAVRRDLTDTMEATRGNTGLLFNIALSYGGRAEIVDAVTASSTKRIAHPTPGRSTNRSSRVISTPPASPIPIS